MLGAETCFRNLDVPFSVPALRRANVIGVPDKQSPKKKKKDHLSYIVSRTSYSLQYSGQEVLELMEMNHRTHHITHLVHSTTCMDYVGVFTSYEVHVIPDVKRESYLYPAMRLEASSAEKRV